MSGRRKERGVQSVRRLLLAGFVVFLGILSAVFYARREPSSPRVAAGERDRSGGLTGLVRAGEGFEYEVSEQNRKLFNIKAERIIESRDDLFVLEGVSVEVTRDDDVTYEVSADRGLYKASEREKMTTLEGNAVIRSSSGAEVRSDGFEVLRKGRLVSSTGPVRYRLGRRLHGTAQQVEAYLKKDRYQLSGKVSIVGGPEDPTFRLRCRRLIFEEANRRIYAEGDVRLAREGIELEGGRITVTLAENSDDIRFVRARYNVKGSRIADDDLQSRVSFAAHELALELDVETGDLRRGEFTARRDEQVFVESSDASQLARRLTAPRVVVDFAAGKPSRAQAFEWVQIHEYFLFAPRVLLVQACSRAAVATFGGGGGFRSLELSRGVDLHQDDMHAVGDRIERQANGSSRIDGTPAAIYTSRGELVAPTIVQVEGGRTVRASGGVRATMKRGKGFAMMRDAEEGGPPVRVTSSEASWDDERETVSFRGEVRAWQGEDYVVADELEAIDGGNLLQGRGSVKTVIKSRRTDDEEATAQERASVEVTAGEMLYRRETRTLRYSGSPLARQAGRTLRCQELELAFDAEDELERMTCRQDVVIEEAGEGRSVRGDLAVYRPAASLLEVEGRPAVLRDPDGVEVRGRVVVYDLETGAANVRATGLSVRGEDAAEGAQVEEEGGQ